MGSKHDWLYRCIADIETDEDVKDVLGNILDAVQTEERRIDAILDTTI